ncbi:hypothetical protein L2E82_09983 [Cichorium intybus]|uniref:Uncharacterized protein n=1 Tax=Cichorium intybus TaxID=13427 RepID=A0ACB9GA45_CICIN|nr:hypothetical protein L2E82_09983 [Cichorium intybus]
MLVMRDEQYDPEWYIDSGFSRHMTGKREELREYRSLRNGGKIRYGNNATDEIKGYGMITNGELSIPKVAYVEGVQHNLISVSQLVVGSGLKVSFDEDGSEIIEKKTKKIVLKSKRKGEMFPLDMKPIKGKPAICLLTKAANDDSWLWNRRLSHMNFRDINKLVLGDLKSEATLNMINFIKQVEVLLRKPDQMIRSNNGTEFKNKVLEDFVVSKGISHNFSAPYTPQQKGVVECRNRSLCEAARTMLSFTRLPLYFWADAIATACFTQNLSTINKQFLLTT